MNVVNNLHRGSLILHDAVQSGDSSPTESEFYRKTDTIGLFRKTINRPNELARQARQASSPDLDARNR